MVFAMAPRRRWSVTALLPVLFQVVKDACEQTAGRLKDSYRSRCTRCGFENVGRRDRRLRNFTDEPDQLTAALLHTLAAY